MDKKKLIEQEVEKILQCFDQTEQIDNNPFIFTRVQTAINNLDKQQNRTRVSLFFENLLRPAFIVGIVILNLITAGFTLSRMDNQLTSKSKVIYTFAKEYSFTQNDYDILKIKNLR